MTRRFLTRSAFVALALLLPVACAAGHPVPDDPRWLTYTGANGPGEGRHVVLIAADQEYRSEQSMPMLARVLAERHGFHCTVLFALNEDGLVDPTLPTIRQDPETQHDIPGLEHLAEADLLILFTRFITLPPDQLGHVIDYLDSGQPILAIRTANHGFLGPFPYEVDGRPVRFGDDILGGTFRGHHGAWSREATRGEIIEAQREHPILRGVADIWGPSDVYRTYPKGKGLPAGCTALVMGQPLAARQPDSPPNRDKIPLPIAWAKHWTTTSGQQARVFHTTMGSARDFENEGLRRLVINAAYWCMGLDDAIVADSDVSPVGEYVGLESGSAHEKLGVVPRPVEDYR